MQSETAQVLFKTRLDQRFDVIVTGTGEYTGTLTVSEGEKVLARQPVPLSYAARFGPDAGDVWEWRRIACEIVDSHLASPS